MHAPATSPDWKVEMEILTRLRGVIKERTFGTPLHDEVKALMRISLGPQSRYLSTHPAADLLEDQAAIRAVLAELGFTAEHETVNRMDDGVLTIREIGSRAEVARVETTADDDVRVTTWRIVLKQMQRRMQPLLEAQEKAARHAEDARRRAEAIGRAAVAGHRNHPLYAIRAPLRRLGLRVV